MSEAACRSEPASAMLAKAFWGMTSTKLATALLEMTSESVARPSVVGAGVGNDVGGLSATVSATSLVSASECVAASSVVGGGVVIGDGELSAMMSATAMVFTSECLGYWRRCRRRRRCPRRSVWRQPRLSANVSAITLGNCRQQVSATALASTSECLGCR